MGRKRIKQKVYNVFVRKTEHYCVSVCAHSKAEAISKAEKIHENHFLPSADMPREWRMLEARYVEPCRNPKAYMEEYFEEPETKVFRAMQGGTDGG
jgi:hypothetical protein